MIRPKHTQQMRRGKKNADVARGKRNFLALSFLSSSRLFLYVMSPFLDRVRTSAEFVRSRAKHVSVCPSAVTELASRMKSTLETTDISVHKIWNDCPLNPVWGESRAGIESVEDICFWIFCIDCIKYVCSIV